VAAHIEWNKIGELLWAAPLAGVAVAMTFSLLILGISRAGDARRDRAGGVATAYSALAVVAALAFVAVVVYGVEIIVRR
jgi:uncharacterized membrane protein